MFSMEKLLVDFVTKEETPIDELKVALPLLDDIMLVHAIYNVIWHSLE